MLTLPGGSGFIAAHILKMLLAKGHNVITTVRTSGKAKNIHEAYPELGTDRLRTELVPDIAVENAFDEVVKIPGIEVVLHTASPFHFRATDPIKDYIEPAVIGTTGILKGIKKFAPQVRRVVVTSSFAAILDDKLVADPSTVFSEESWNPVEIEDIKGDNRVGYLASKKLAEKAAWDFVRDEKPNFDLVTVCPPMVYGPVVHHLEGLAAINTSNARIVDAATGVWRAEGKIPAPGVLNWVDVRDVALAHVLTLEKPALGGHRLFVTGGLASNRQIVDAIRKGFPQLADRLPAPDAPGGEIPAVHYQYNNDATKKLLGFEWTPLETCVVDTIKSLESHLHP